MNVPSSGAGIGLSARLSGTGRRGFTLIELLVVVSIIALLISILLPSLRSAREQARMVKCLAHMRGMGQAGNSFALDNKNRFQLVADPSGVNRADPSHRRFAYDQQTGEILSWPTAMAKSATLGGYEHNWDWGVRAPDWATAEQNEDFMDEGFELAICPADRVRIATPYYPTGASLGALPTEVQPPLPDGPRYFGYLSFGINEDVVGADDNVGGSAYRPACWRDGNWGQIQPGAGERLEGNLDKVFDPGTCLLMVDSGFPSTDAARDAQYGDTQYVADAYINLIISARVVNGPYLADAVGKWPLRVARKRHPKGALNVLFCDFHGEKVNPTDFWTTQYGPLPRKYNPRARVSPYRPWVTEE
jgi:prepilin-type N-terminal cleavage/methylation domain-containing protein/prepilin-type processing-associated H-X9-DG protein